MIGALRYDYDNGGYLKLAGLYRNIAYDSKNLLAINPEFKYKTANGWGLMGMANIFFNKKSGLVNNLQAQWNIGKGISDYFLAVGGSGLDGFANENVQGILNLRDVHSGFISYQRFWTSKFHTMVIASYNHFSGGEETLNSWNEMTNYHFTLNLSYNFLDNLMVGFEPQMGYKELKMDQDITKGKDALRINFGVLYNFKRLKTNHDEKSTDVFNGDAVGTANVWTEAKDHNSGNRWNNSRTRGFFRPCRLYRR